MRRIELFLYNVFLYLKYLIFFTSGEGIIYQVKKRNLTYLSVQALQDLYRTINQLEKKKIDGIFIEAGCALGGSALVIASAKTKERKFNIYDVFDMIPPPSLKDGTDVHERYHTIKSGKSEGLGGEIYYGYMSNLEDIVISNFTKYSLDINSNKIRLYKGLFQDTIKINSGVAFAHIDCDWYESVLTCLKEIEPYLVSHGVLVIDDYNEWSGCKIAVDEYFRDKRDRFLFVLKSKLHIIRIS